MEKKYTNIKKVLNTIDNEEKYQKELYKKLWFNEQLKESQVQKLENKIRASKEKIAKLKDKLKKS